VRMFTADTNLAMAQPATAQSAQAK
jgi:hypothetical protein